MPKTVKVADKRDFVNALYYGDGGTGKTTALASLANQGRVLYVDAESGIKRRPLERMGVKVDNLELPDWEDGVLTFDQLEDMFWEVKRDLDDDPDAWAGVVWDSGTEIYHALLDEIVGKRVKKAEAAMKASKNISEAMADRFFIDRDNYGVMSEQIRSLLRRFRDLPCHFGISFLERRDQDDSTGKVRIGPAITPGLQSDVIGWHDVVCRTSLETGGVYLGTFRPEGVRQGKDRYGMLPNPLIDPSFSRVIGYITEELDADTDPVQRQLVDAQDKDGAADDESPIAKAKRQAAAKRSQASAKG